MSGQTAKRDEPNSRGGFRGAWDKYALIVVGNVVFFLLLYFVSYRPHNATARANEFLQVAQRQEADGRLEAAEVLYSVVSTNYAETTAATLADDRLPLVRKMLGQARRDAKVRSLPPELDLKTIIHESPAKYLSALLAEHYDRITENDRPAYFAALDGYLRIAFSRGEIDHQAARRLPAFRHDALQRRYFDLRAKCGFDDDLLYDDVYVRNENMFPWHDVVMQVQVRQGDNVEDATVRAQVLKPGAKTDALEIRIKDDGGPITCKLIVRSKEGELRGEQTL